MRLIDSTVARALNHLLEAEPWARARLAPFAGAHCELHLAALPPLRFCIAEDGTARPADDDLPAALVLRLGPQALPALARGEDHFVRAIEMSGDAGLGNEVLFLARHLRWDLEEDLSAWIGDAAAHRLVRATRALGESTLEAASRVASGIMESAVEEGGWLVRRSDLAGLGRDVAGLRDALERLELRLERLEPPAAPCDA